MKCRILLSLSIVLSSTAWAELAEPGFSGQIGLMTGFGSETSNLVKKTKKGELNSKGESDSSFIFAPQGELYYTFGKNNDQQVFLGTGGDSLVENGMAFEIGYALEYGQESSIAFSYLPTIASGEVWQDPFITDTARKKTDISGDTFRIQLDNILDIGLSGEIATYTQDVKTERSGTLLATDLLTTEISALQRDAEGYYGSISIGLPISQSSFIEPELFYQKHDADGDAVSFSRYGGALTYMIMVDENRFSVGGEYIHTKYDATHPIFNKKQKDQGYGFNLGYERQDIMGWKNWGINALAGYSNTNSNITFYDAEGYFLGVGLSYRF